MQIIAGTHKNRKILTPKGFKTRPTSGRMRGTLFNICQQKIDDAKFLDLFAGSGAMGLEAVSRGAKSSTFVDKSRECIRCIQHNVTVFGMEEKAQVLHGDVFQWIEKLAKGGNQFDLIYVDPPYETMTDGITYSNLVLKKLDQSPLLKGGGLLFIEEGRGVLTETEPLSTLTFINHRRVGRSLLFQYEKRRKEIE